MSKKHTDGFSLLEVSVAVAILGLSLTAIFSSELGAVKTAIRSRKINVATLLARCKMGEIEEQVAKEGLPAIDDVGEDSCCEEMKRDGFRCEWRLERIVLPDSLEEAAEEEDPLSANALDPSIGDFLGSGDDDGLAQLAISLSYPSLKPAIEEQVRRATVRVIWSEGRREQSFDVVQFLVDEPPPEPEDDADEESEEEGP